MGPEVMGPRVMGPGMTDPEVMGPRVMGPEVMLMGLISGSYICCPRLRIGLSWVMKMMHNYPVTQIYPSYTSIPSHTLAVPFGYWSLGLGLQ